MNKYEGEKPPKSGKPRVAAYPKLLQRILEPHRGGPDEYAFSIREGRPMSLNSISGAMKRAVGRAIKDGIKKRKEAAGDTTEVTEEEIEKEKSTKRITLHGLRHSINTALLSGGRMPQPRKFTRTGNSTIWRRSARRRKNCSAGLRGNSNMLIVVS